MAIVWSGLAGLCAGLLLERLNVPAGILIGGMVGVGILGLSGVPTAGPPLVLRTAALLIIGWSLGADVNRDLLRALGDVALPMTIGLAGLLLAGALAAWVLSALDVVDPATAFLAMSPGGLSQMAAFSAALGANAPLVATVHLVRILAVMILAPIVARFAASGS